MIAVIDIGSNSVRLMLWTDGKTLLKRICTTRLGKSLVNGLLLAETMEKTICAVSDFAAMGKENQAEVYVFATAAVRRAKNGIEFCRLLKERTGLTVDVLTGEEEAFVGLCGALGDSDGAMIDLGGGSTEICCRKEGKISFSKSLNLGAVRLYDECRDDRKLLEKTIQRHLSTLTKIEEVGKIYTVGGTASTLACLKLQLKEYDGTKIQDLPLSRKEVEEFADKLCSYSVAERKLLAGMDPARADIIAGGAMFLAKLMEKLSIQTVFASDRDNLEGYLKFKKLV